MNRAQDHPQTFLDRLLAWLLGSRYLLLSLALFLLMALKTQEGLWVGDFWEHAAVIKELAAHPFSPSHPIFSLNAPHAFASPYALLVALVMRLSARPVLEVLPWFGLLNLGLFLAGLPVFIWAIRRNHIQATAFYSLLLILFLWGTPTWNYSGFYHLYGLQYVLPYPSTFALGLAFFGLGIYRLYQQHTRVVFLIAISLLSTVLILTHQISFFFLAAGLAAMLPGHKNQLWRETLRLAISLGAALLLAIAWPYYPFLSLMLGESARYHASNQVMYQAVLARTWPLLLGLPLLALDFYRHRRSALPWMFLLLLGVYLFGWLAQAYSYGRVISYLAIILQITLAAGLVELERKAPWVRPNTNAWRLVFSLLAVALLAGLAFKEHIQPVLTFDLARESNRYEKYLFLSSLVSPDEVVMARPDLNLYLPAFGGKVVSYPKPLAFVSDQEQRLEDVKRFFDPESNIERRQRLLRQYNVRYILLPRIGEVDFERLRSQLSELGELVYRSKQFLLYRVPEP